MSCGQMNGQARGEREEEGKKKKGRKGGETKKAKPFFKEAKAKAYLMDRLQKDNPCLEVDMRKKKDNSSLQVCNYRNINILFCKQFLQTVLNT